MKIARREPAAGWPGLQSGFEIIQQAHGLVEELSSAAGAGTGAPGTGTGAGAVRSTAATTAPSAGGGNRHRVGLGGHPAGKGSDVTHHPRGKGLNRTDHGGSRTGTRQTGNRDGGAFAAGGRARCTAQAGG